MHRTSSSIPRIGPLKFEWTGLLGSRLFPLVPSKVLRFRVEGSRLQVVLAECLPFWGFGCAATGVGGSAGSGYGASLTVVACPCAATHPHVRLQVVWELGVLGFRVARSDPSY